MPGWEPESLFCGAASISCLSLKHSNGQRAIWYLDQQLSRIGGGYKELSVQHRPSFAQLARQFEAAIRSRILCARGNIEPRLHDPLQLSALARHDLTSYLLEDKLPGHITLVLEGADKREVSDALELLGGLGNYPDAIRHLEELLIATDVKSAFCQSFARQSLALPSPLDGALEICNGTLLLQPRAIAYRFIDKANSIPYYVLCADWRHSICAVYFPSIQLTVYGSRSQRSAAENSLGGAFYKVIFQHASAQATDLQHYRPLRNAQISIVYSYWHLGHHLWNELAGIDYLLGRVPSDQIPTLYVLQADKTEMYGKLDELFPR